MHHGRSQAHETLKTMTTIIMRTSHDNCDRLFSALFQGFLSLGNLSVTLIFHEHLQAPENNPGTLAVLSALSVFVDRHGKRTIHPVVS